MSTVHTHMTMSLDGFIADPNDGIDELFGWYGAGEVTLPTKVEQFEFHVDQASADLLTSYLDNAGALVCGRRLFDITNGWDDHHPMGPPVVVVTSIVLAARGRLAELAFADDARHRVQLRRPLREQAIARHREEDARLTVLKDQQHR